MFVYVVAQINVKQAEIVNLEVFSQVERAAEACGRVDWAENWASNLVTQDWDHANGRVMISPDGKERLEIGRVTLDGTEKEEIIVPSRSEMN